MLSHACRGIFCIAGLLLLVQIAAAQMNAEEAKAGFANAFREQNWPEATRFAEVMVDRLSVGEAGASAELTQALLYLSGAAFQAGDYEKVVATTERALSLLEQQKVVDLGQQLEFQWFQGKAYAELRDDSAAVKAYSRALVVSEEMRPRDYSIDAEMWDDLLVIAKRGDDVYKQGNFAAEQALKAREQQYGKKSVGLVEGLDKYAAWLRYSSQFGKERKTRKRSVKLLEREYGSRDYRIASQLRAITTGYIASGGDQEDAVDAIERALELFYPETAKAAYELGQVTAVWADVHVVYINPDQAPDIYAAAWITFAANKQLGPDFANKYFAKPKRLYYSMPGRPVGRNGDNYFGRGYVVMQFNVEANGLVSEVDMVEVSAPDIDRKAFYRAYQNARYRPRVQNGEAIITVGEKLRNSYDWTN